jgi:hypothetical protein
MSFGFHIHAVDKARRRQRGKPGWGYRCARCGEYLKPLSSEGKGWFAIPRIPIEEGGRKADNCVIVCPNCRNKMGQDGTKVISDYELPFFYGGF